MAENAEQTVQAVEKVVECFKDGFQFSDIITSVKVAAEIAETITTMDGPAKKQFVIDVVKQAYKKVDPDIPYLPGFIERPLENYVLDNLLPSLIDMLVDATKGKFNINKD